MQDWCFVSIILEYCLIGVFWSTRLVFCKQYFEVLSILSILEYKTGVLSAVFWSIVYLEYETCVL